MATITQETKGGAVVRRFVPTEIFEDNGNAYVKGQRYNLRAGNDALAAKLDEWISQGKVVWA